MPTHIFPGPDGPDGPDKKKKKKQPPKPRGIFEQPIHGPDPQMLRALRRRDSARQLRAVASEPPPVVAQDATRADLRALVPPDEKEGQPLDDLGIGRFPEDRLESQNRDVALHKMLWYGAHAYTQWAEGTVEEARDLYDMLVYMVEPPQNAEEWKAYRDWASSTASWSEMPKGVLGVELPADLAGTAPGAFLSIRDLVKDFKHGEQSWWNAFDVIGVIPAVGMIGTLGKAGKLIREGEDAGKAVRRMARTARQADEVRLVRVGRADGFNNEPGSRAGMYIFDTPQGQVEVAVSPPGTHNYTGEVSNSRHQVTAPKGVDKAPASETVWTSIKMKDGTYTRGNEGVLGTAVTREIFRQLGELFPEANYIGGHRVTGSKVGPEAEKFSGQTGVDTWVYMGDRSRVTSQSGHRQIMALAEENPEAYAELVEQAKKEGIDISPEALREREANLMARGLPYQLSPVQLRNHERELQRIFLSFDDPAEAEAEMLDYLDRVGLEAIHRDTGQPTRLGQDLIDGVTNPRHTPVSEILNPQKVTPEELDSALARMQDEGLNPRTGARTAERAYQDRVRETVGPRVRRLLQPEGFDVDLDNTRYVFNRQGYDLIDVRDSGNNHVAEIMISREPGHYSGMRVDGISSDYGDRVTGVLAEGIVHSSIDASPEVMDLATTTRAARRAAHAEQADVERAARIADLMESEGTSFPFTGLMWAEVEDRLIDLAGFAPERASATVDALEALADGRVSSRQTFGQLARGEVPDLPEGAQRIADNLTEVTEGPRTRRPRASSAVEPLAEGDRYIAIYRRHRNPAAPLDPNNPASRTGREGAEGRRRGNYGDIYHPRTPFYIRGQQPESMFSDFPIQIEARIPESRVYDIKEDPRGYVRRWQDGELDDFTEVEDLIHRDPDFDALMDPDRGQLWSFVEPQEVHRVNLETGEWLDSSGRQLERGVNPMEARGLEPEAMLGVTETQTRSAARRGTQAAEAAEAEPPSIPQGTPEPPPEPRARGRGARAFNEATPPEVTDWDIEIAEKLNAGNGVSMRLDGTPLPQSLRYVVSPNKNTETIFGGGTVTPLEVATFRELHKGALSEPGAVFGAWLDDGELYMDVSRGFSSRAAAMDVAQTGDQMSIADRKYLPRETGGLADEADWDRAFISNELYDAERGVTAWPDERSRVMARKRTFDHMPELGQQADERMLRNMGPQTRAWYDGSRPHIQERVREMYRMMLSDEELATMMALGEQTKGWYEGAAGTIRNAYGEMDAPQFTALLAATSPNVPVSSNTRFAQDLWSEWNQWGRPRDPDAIEAMFDSVMGGSGIHQLEGHQVAPGAARGNVVTVLSHPEPYEYFGDPALWARGDVLSGPKVDPFFANTMGELRRMTVDTHQLRYGPSPANSLSRRAAFEAGFTGGAETLADALEMPEALKVAQGQEMSWEPMRQLGEMAGRGRGSVEDLLFDANGNLRMDTLEELDVRMRQAEDFGQFLGSDEGRMLVGAAGGNPDFDVVHRTGLPPEQAQAARQRVLDNPEHVRAAARRSDMANAGDYLFQIAPWLAGGAAAGLSRQFANSLNAEQPPQPEGPQGLFAGVGLPPLAQRRQTIF